MYLDFHFYLKIFAIEIIKKAMMKKMWAKIKAIFQGK